MGVDAIEGESRRVEAFKTLRQVMAKAVRWGLLESSPCDRVEPPRRPRHEPQVLDAAQASAYLRLFRGTEVEAVVLVALGGALRRSEIAALSWGDVSPSGVVTIDKALTSVEGRPVLGPPKTPNSTRRVHLPQFVAERLNALRMPGRFPLAMDSRGGRMNPDNISKAYRRVLVDAPPGLPRVPLRDLRHTSLTLTLEAGADVLAVSRRAGHSNVGITSAYYLRPHESVDEAAAEGLGGLL